MSELYDDDQTDDGAQQVGNGPNTKPTSGKLENVASLMQKSRTRRVLIATIGVVLLVGAITTVSIVSKNRQPAAEPSAALTGASVGQAPTSLDEKPNDALAKSSAYQEMMAKAGADRASEAALSGQSTQPLAASVEASFRPNKTPAEIEELEAKARKEKAEAEVVAAAQRQAMENAQRQSGQQAGGGQVQQAQDPALQQMMQNAAQAIQALAANRGRGAAVYAMVDNTTSGTAATAMQVTSPGSSRGDAAPQASVQQASEKQYTLIAAGTIEAARLDVGVNTSRGGSFAATIVTGRYAGAKIIGTSQLMGEAAQMTCKSISFPDQGASMPAGCEILDPQTGEPGTATDVDRKLLVKYGIKPIAAGFSAVADYLKSSGTTVVVNGSTTVSSQPELTGKKTAQIVGGSAAQQLNTDANALDTTPVARVVRGTVVGVFFTQDVVYTPKVR